MLRRGDTSHLSSFDVDEQHSTAAPADDDHQVIITCHRREGGGGILIVIWAIKHTTLSYLQCQCIKQIVLIEIDIINTANNNNEGVIPEINTPAAERRERSLHVSGKRENFPVHGGTGKV